MLLNLLSKRPLKSTDMPRLYERARYPYVDQSWVDLRAPDCPGPYHARGLVVRRRTLNLKLTVCVSGTGEGYMIST